jgi:hypothetical protein
VSSNLSSLKVKSLKSDSKKRSIDDLMSELKGGGGVAKVCVCVCVVCVCVCVQKALH